MKKPIKSDREMPDLLSQLTKLKSGKSEAGHQPSSERELGKRKRNDPEDSKAKPAMLSVELSSRAASEWGQRDIGVVRSVDIACKERSIQAQARNFVGWKTDRDGNKSYSTFRSGERVIASGQEAFRLSCGDKQSSKRPKAS